MSDGNLGASSPPPAKPTLITGAVLAAVGVILIVSTISLSLVATGLLVDIMAIVFLHRARNKQRTRAESTRLSAVLLSVCYFVGSVTLLVFGALGLATWWK